MDSLLLHHLMTPILHGKNLLYLVDFLFDRHYVELGGRGACLQVIVLLLSLFGCKVARRLNRGLQLSGHEHGVLPAVVGSPRAIIRFCCGCVHVLGGSHA